jgi:DNA-directed RNA polymerase subunit RPC12/RpoP
MAEQPKVHDFHKFMSKGTKVNLDDYRKEHKDKIHKGWIIGSETYRCKTCGGMGTRHKIASFVFKDKTPHTTYTCLNCGKVTEVDHEKDCTCVACNYINKVMNAKVEPKTEVPPQDEIQSDVPDVPKGPPS